MNARRLCWHTSFLSSSFLHFWFLACFRLFGTFSPIHFFIFHFLLFIGWLIPCKDAIQEREECKNHICSSLYMENILLEAHCDNMRYLRKTGSSFKNHRSSYTLNYIKLVTSEERLTLCTVENLGPSGSKRKVFEIKRNCPRMRCKRHYDEDG